jgi:hypothetical protein
MYNNVGGERMALYDDNIHTTMYGDLTKQQLLDFDYAVMNLKERSYEEIPHTGLSSDYVYREAKRSLDGVAGTKTLIWPGIDIDIPTEADHSKCTPQGVKAAVQAAFRAGVPGVILSRKYSEMKLANLGGAGEAVRELRRLLNGEVLTYHGEHYDLDKVQILRSRQDQVPLLVGVNGKRALAHAARHADIIGLTMLGRTFEDGQRHEVRWEPERLDTTVNYIREQAGERWGQIELNVLVQAVVVTDDRREAAEQVAARVPGLSVHDALRAPFLAIGTYDEIADHLVACRDRWGISYFSVRDIGGFAPVIELLQGV